MTTMTADERDIMQAHVGYWTGKVAAGNTLVFGTVADPEGGCGIGIIKSPTAPKWRYATRSGIGFSCDIIPMPRLTMAGG